jgi:glucose/arabinose dehydrogenase
MNRLLLLSLLPLAVCLLPSSTLADLDYPDFNSSAGLALQGDALTTASLLRLTSASNNERGAAWFTSAQRVSTPWIADFEFQLLGGPGADGFAFVIQNDSTSSLSGTGCQLGYHGIPNSIAIEFDSYSNSSCGVGSVSDIGVPHISVHTLGTSPNSVDEAASIGATALVPAFSDGGVHTAQVRYIPGNLFIYVDDMVTPVLTVAVDLQATLSLGSQSAWLGFTAATGGLNETHDILSFHFDEDATTGSGNSPPSQPAMTEPAVDGQILNPSDVHMETTPFVDADIGDQHLCSDFEIWQLAPPERVWYTSCIGGVTKLHTHLGDGLFENSHSGLTELKAGTQYRVRARHRDDSSDPLTEWSPWGERLFITGSASNTFPLVTEEIEDHPAPNWSEKVSGQQVVLPAGTPPAFMRLDHPQHGLLLEYAGFDGNSNTITNPPELSEHVDVRLHLHGGSSGLSLPETDLVVYDHDCSRFEILLPSVNLSAGQSAYFWVADGGPTYVGNSGQDEPDFMTLARGLDIPWAVKQPGFQVESFAEGFTLPVNIAFVHDPGPQPDAPFFYVTELYGQVRVVRRNGSVGTFASGLVDFIRTGNFPGSGEQGLAGIAIDPTSGDVFVSVLHDSVSNPGTHYPKVVRLSSTDGGQTAALQTTIIDMVGESQGQSHQISNLTIHPDGKLLVHMGDGFNTSTALNLDSYRGKILRMNLDGSPATDNPFYNPGNGTNASDFIWAYGVRNPFGGAWRALDGLQYLVGNGPSVDRIGQVIGGRNFGWTGTNTSMSTNALFMWNPAHGPVNLAFVQPQTFGGSGFPAEKMDHAFVSESGPTYATGGQARGKRISEFVLDASGNLLSGPIPLLEYAGTGKETAVGLAAGPDGLYMTSLYRDQGFNPTSSGARIYRVYATPGWDCNGNGIEDACDIASGVELDLDGNGLPDSCDCAGVSFCEATVNSTGRPASISSNGICSIAANLFVVSAQSVPDTPGVFFFSQNRQNNGQGIPFYNGRLCVGPGVIRLPVTLGSGGTASYQLDFTAGSAAQIQPGQTWHFQYWYRDVLGGGAGVNTSDALSVAFQ